MSNSSSRPLSPHLSVYKMHPGMVMSGLHRITGICLTIGLVLLTWWLVAAAAGPESFARVQWLLGTAIGKLALLGWTFSIFYHFGTGVRHIGYDLGLFLSNEGSLRAGWAAAIFAVAMTGVTWSIGCIALAVK
ncbi:MAG: succinate dehydrogenase, cytochrome b556 subunit [Rhodospirillaceae bacterium]